MGPSPIEAGMILLVQILKRGGEQGVDLLLDTAHMLEGILYWRVCDRRLGG